MKTIYAALPALFLVCCLAPCAALAQECPEGSPCVTSQTWLVNGAGNTMDAYTIATQDYTSSFYYGLCINLAVLRVNPNSVYITDWTVVIPSAPQPFCTAGTWFGTEPGNYPGTTFPTTPGEQYAAIGVAQLQAPSYEVYYGIGNNLWVDPENFSNAVIGVGSSEDTIDGVGWTFPPVVFVVTVTEVLIAMNGSGALATAYDANADSGTVQILLTDTSQQGSPTRDVTNNNTVLNTVNVLVGQQIILSATVTPPPGVIVTKQSWSNPTGTAVAS